MPVQKNQTTFGVGMTWTTTLPDLPLHRNMLIGIGSPRSPVHHKNWSLMAKLLGTATDKKPYEPVCSRWYWVSCNDKIAYIRHAIEGVSVESSLLPAPTVFFRFEQYMGEEIQKIISAMMTESCALRSTAYSDPERIPTGTLTIYSGYMQCNTHRQFCLPVSQHHAIITPCLKITCADQSDVKNHWQISNLTFMSKIVKKLVYLQLVVYLKLHELMQDLQPSYRHGHSINTAILKVISGMLMTADHGQMTLLGLLDLSTAFDMVDHSILIGCLCNAFGIQGLVLPWIESFVFVRTQTALLEVFCRYHQLHLVYPKEVFSDLGIYLLCEYTCHIWLTFSLLLIGIVLEVTLMLITHNCTGTSQLIQHYAGVSAMDLCIGDINCLIISNRL